jgi:DNA-binding CsgD family transcriptional regulator
MAKSTIDQSRRENAEPEKLSPPAEPEGESFRKLQSENERLRDLVVSLSAALMRNLGLNLASGRAVGIADTTQSSCARDVLSETFPGHQLLTARERVVLAQIVKGASSKEAARTLAVSARTVESHRANILLKLGAKNTAELVRIVLGE